MRILGVGDTVDLGDMYLRLQAAGHEVRVCAAEERAHATMAGMLRFVPDWRQELDWIRSAGADGLVLFETAADGEAQDALRVDGFHVVGGSALGDRLEADRAFGQQVLGEAGLMVAASHHFVGFEAAAEFVRRRAGRWVLKMNGAGFASTRTYVGALDDGRDMAALLELEAARWPYPQPPELVLMEHVQGVEVGVGAFFDGRAFLAPANLDWEHKRFFPGDLGELTGEMGTLATYRGAERLFGEVLAPVAPLLASSGYRGYVNVNTIVNERGVWPLEFTCRFGYPGFAVLDALHAEPWDAILQRLVHPVADGRAGRVRTHAGYSVGVVLTVPPFPYPHGYELLSKGMPVCFRGELDEAMRDRLHYGEVAMAGGRLVTSGIVGYVMVVTGRGRTVRSAQRQAYDAVDRVVIPKARWRHDIGDRFVREDRRALESLGYLSARERAA